MLFIAKRRLATTSFALLQLRVDQVPTTQFLWPFNLLFSVQASQLLLNISPPPLGY